MSRTTLDWAVKADTYANSGNTEQARECVLNGAKAAEDILDWSLLADSAFRVCPSRSKEYLLRMEALAQNVFDFYVCATTNHDIGHGNRAIAQMEKAESLANRTFEWIECADAWFVLGDADKQASCLLKAEEEALDCSDWCSCAVAWFQLDEADHAQRCSDKAEEVASSVSDFCRCSSARRQMGSIDKAKEMMLQAEQLARAPQDWLKCEAEWKLLDDVVQADRCGDMGDVAFKDHRSTEAQQKMFAERITKHKRTLSSPQQR